MNPNLKYQSTGDNDSVEDALIAIANIKTVDGKFVNAKAQFEALEQAWKASHTAWGWEDHGRS